MPSWTILKTIHSHTPVRPLITIIITVIAHMVDKELKSVQNAVDKNI